MHPPGPAPLICSPVQLLPGVVPLLGALLLGLTPGTDPSTGEFDGFPTAGVAEGGGFVDGGGLEGVGGLVGRGELVVGGEGKLTVSQVKVLGEVVSGSAAEKIESLIKLLIHD